MKNGEGRESARCCSWGPWIGTVGGAQPHFPLFARGPTGRCGILQKNSERGLISCSGKCSRISRWCSNESQSGLGRSCREPAQSQSPVIEFPSRKSREPDHVSDQPDQSTFGGGYA